MWKEHSSTPTAAGVALGMVLCKAAVRVHALSVDVDRLDDPRLPTFAQSNMQGTVGRLLPCIVISHFVLCTLERVSD